MKEKRRKIPSEKKCCDNCVSASKRGTPEAYSIRCLELDKYVFKSDCCSRWRKDRWEEQQ